MVTKSEAHRTSRPGGLPALIFHYVFRLFLIIIALVVMGLYGRDLRTADKLNAHADARWVFAEVTAGLSFLTAVAYMLPWVRSYKVWPWDVVLFIFWTALFGVHAKMVLGHNCAGNGGVCPGRLNSAMWVDMVGMLGWFVSAIIGGIMWYRDKHGRSSFTGRAVVV